MNNMDYNNLMRDTLNKYLANQVFSSNEFCKKLRAKGLPKRYTSSGKVGAFLNQYCVHALNSKRYWVRPSVDFGQTQLPIKNKLNEYDDYNKESEAINFLKSKGYKISKLVTTYEEV